MMSLKIDHGEMPASIKLPPSKSYANRALVLAALEPRPFTIHQLPESTDVSLLVDSLKACGLLFSHENDSLTVLNSFPDCEGKGSTIKVGEGGTTARFLASMLLRGKSPYTLILGKRLKERPWQEFIDFVIRYKGYASLKGDKLFIQGPIKLPTSVEMDCSRTTQFATGIQLAFATLGVKVKPTNLDSSQSYWDMTEYLLDQHQSSCAFVVPHDWSSASYPMSFAALNRSIFFPGLKYDAHQSDAKILCLLKDFSAIEEDDSGITVMPVQEHKSILLDVSDCLDLVPALAFFLGHIKGTHELKGIKNLVYKESDRLNEVVKLLTVYGRKTLVTETSLIIHGIPERMEAQHMLTFPNDHRMVMTGSLFLRHHGGGTVTPTDAVDKSWPAFFEHCLCFPKK